MPDVELPRPIAAWKLIFLFFAAFAVLNFGIPAYFGALPLVEQFGRAVCHWFFGI